jgi:hypothetical protein
MCRLALGLSPVRMAQMVGNVQKFAPMKLLYVSDTRLIALDPVAAV